MPPSRKPQREPYSYLHRDTVIDGDVVVEGRLRIDGTVRGSVRTGGILEVAPAGRVEGGPVRAAEIRIAGSVVGDVHAEDRAEIWRGGLVVGDVYAASLDVEEGARFRGRSVMRDGEEDDRASSSAASGADAEGARSSGSDAKGAAVAGADPNGAASGVAPASSEATGTASKELDRGPGDPLVPGAPDPGGEPAR